MSGQINKHESHITFIGTYRPKKEIIEHSDLLSKYAGSWLNLERIVAMNVLSQKKVLQDILMSKIIDHTEIVKFNQLRQFFL